MKQADCQYQGAKKSLPLMEYLQAPGISKHDLDLIHQSPRHYEDKMCGLLPDKKTAAMDMGTALHSLVLEKEKIWVERPETYTDAKGTVKAWNGNSTYCKNWMAENRGKIVLSAKDAQWMVAANAMVANDHFARSILKVGEPEVSLFATDPNYGLKLKCRPDWANGGVYADLKTTMNARTDAFSRQMAQNRYHVQAAMIRRVCSLLERNFTDFYFIIVEKCDPPRINVRRLSDAAIDIGDMIVEDELQKLLICKETDWWPGYSGDSGSIQEITLPAWAMQEGMFGEEPLKLKIGGREVEV